MPRIILTPAVGPLRPYTPVRDGAWDEAKAAHLLRRAGFGARPGDLRRLVSMGFPAAIDAVLRGQLPGEEIPPPAWAGEPSPRSPACPP